MRALTESRDARAGLCAAVFGIGYLVAAFQIEPDPSTTSVVGPRVAPVVIGAALVVCSLVLVAQAVRAPATGRPSVGAEKKTARMSQRQVLTVSVIFAAYIVAFIPIGYLLSTFAFLVVLTTYVDRAKLVRNCIYAAVFSPSVYALFTYVLQVQLPPGLLG